MDSKPIRENMERAGWRLYRAKNDVQWFMRDDLVCADDDPVEVYVSETQPGIYKVIADAASISAEMADCDGDYALAVAHWAGLSRLLVCAPVIVLSEEPFVVEECDPQDVPFAAELCARAVMGFDAQR